MGLSVFCGHFPRDAAEAVAEASLDVLSSLVDKSLLRITASGRYNLHELVRQLAAEKLAESPRPGPRRLIAIVNTIVIIWLNGSPI